MNETLLFVNPENINKKQPVEKQKMNVQSRSEAVFKSDDKKREVLKKINKMIKEHQEKNTFNSFAKMGKIENTNEWKKEWAEKLDELLAAKEKIEKQLQKKS